MPICSAERPLDGAFNELNRLVGDNTSQQSKVTRIRQQYDQWNTFAQTWFTDRSAGEVPSSNEFAQARGLADAARAGVAAFIDPEEQLRAERSATVQRTTQTIVVGSIAATLFAGATLALFLRRQLRVLVHNYQQALGERAQQATELQTRADALSESERRFRQVTEGIPQMVWITRPDGYHEYFNQRWYDYTGTKPGQTDGEGWSHLLHPEDQAATFAAWQRALATGEPYRVEYRFKNGTTGEYHWFIGEALPLRDKHNRIVKWFGTCTDIDQQKQQEVRLRQQTTALARATAALEERNRELDQFAYITSHDLKAPLRGIANLSQWIEEDLGEQVTDDVRHQLELLRGRVHRMEALIDGILQYSRVGRTNVAAEQVDVASLVEDVIDLLAPPPTFTMEVAPGLPTLHTARVPLQQVFHNLLGNAIKHHHRPNGHIRVCGEEAGEFWRFTIADDGPGIAPQYHQKIFQIFQTLAPRDKVEGSGLGLALVKKIVERQGGTIAVQSDVGQGTTFVWTWPKEEGGK
jgi:PAS domain S-box-containing protein